MNNPRLSHEKQIDCNIERLFESDVKYRQQFMLYLLSLFNQHKESASAIAQSIKDNKIITDYLRLCVLKTNTSQVRSQRLYCSFRNTMFYNGKSIRWFEQQLEAIGMIPQMKLNDASGINCMVYSGYALI